ncbi:MAG: amino acid transporter substrate-binding protein branched-chain amino acid transport system [Candidatus Nomurabacteria bacterium]|nr:amino acid transporter substrate-binding protein branched-chain amino acid transport system [Candidatus Nomurabacteria bacterium]
MLKNRLFILLLGFVIILAALIYKDRKPGVSYTETIKIGAILPLSGDFSSAGEEINRGAQIAVKEYKDKGYNINYIVEDDQFDSVKMVSAAQKLTQADKVDAVFGAAGEEARPTGQIFNKAKVPLLIGWDSNEELKTSGNYIFTIGFTSEANAKKTADFAYTDLGLRKMAILGHIDPVADVLADTFSKEFSSLGGQIVLRDRVQVSTKDFRSYITKMKADGAEGVYFIFLPPSNEVFLKQADQLNLNAKLFGADAVQDYEIKDGSDAAEGLYYSSIFTEKPEEMKKKYKEMFGEETGNPSFVSVGYDSAVTLTEAKIKAIKNNTTVTEALKNLKTNATTFPVNMNGGNFSERVEKIFQVKDGKSVEVK